jgi:hypothetical protein
MVERLLGNETPPPTGILGPLTGERRAHQAEVDQRRLEADYVRYARIASGQEPPDGPAWNAVTDDPSGLERYIHVYLPHEILHWGGEVIDMFSETCKGLKEQGLSLDDFVPWWFQRSRPADRPYDFFLLKIDRFVEFVAERAPALIGPARREAEALRQGYEEANVGGRNLMESCP